jgi:hypothetical protein
MTASKMMPSVQRQKNCVYPREKMTLVAPTKFRVPLKPPSGGVLMSDHVIPLPSRLERAAIKIKKAISKRNGPIQDWIDANIELAEALIEARHEFGDNDAAFGAWCRYNGLTKDVLAKNERVALIDMGANPQRMREVLQKTERRSIPLIYKHEWAFPKAGKGLRNLKEHAKPIFRKSPRKQSKVIKVAEAAAEVQVEERGVVEWGSLFVYSVLAYWLISFIAYWIYSL